jgi:hypothetical protein
MKTEFIKIVWVWTALISSRLGPVLDFHSNEIKSWCVMSQNRVLKRISGSKKDDVGEK